MIKIKNLIEWNYRFFTPASPKNEDHSENTHNNEKKCAHKYSCTENIIRVKQIKYFKINFFILTLNYLSWIMDHFFLEYS